MTARTWPIQPLLDLPGVTRRRVQRLGGFSTAQYNRLLATGLSDHQADRTAIRLGIHPALVWADWVDAGLTPVDRAYLAGGWRQAWLWNEEAA